MDLIKLKNLKIPACKKFNGYKPCTPYKNCLEDGCVVENDATKIGIKILIISLDSIDNNISLSLKKYIC